MGGGGGGGGPNGCTPTQPELLTRDRLFSVELLGPRQGSLAVPRRIAPSKPCPRQNECYAADALARASLSALHPGHMVHSTSARLMAVIADSIRNQHVCCRYRFMFHIFSWVSNQETKSPPQLSLRFSSTYLPLLLDLFNAAIFSVMYS